MYYDYVIAKIYCEPSKTDKQTSMFAITNVIGLNDDHVRYFGTLFQRSSIVPTFLLRINVLAYIVLKFAVPSEVILPRRGNLFVRHV